MPWRSTAFGGSRSASGSTAELCRRPVAADRPARAKVVPADGPRRGDLATLNGPQYGELT